MPSAHIATYDEGTCESPAVADRDDVEPLHAAAEATSNTNRRHSSLREKHALRATIGVSHSGELAHCQADPRHPSSSAGVVASPLL
jgi:hypothetical protein